MKSNLYAIVILAILCVTAALTENYICKTTDNMQASLYAAHESAAQGDYAAARTQLTKLLQTAEQRNRLLLFLVRRSQLDKVNETLATLPYYAQPDNAADLSVELFRAYEQLEQIRRSFIAAF